MVVHEDGFNVIVGNDQKPLPRKAGELDYAALGAELAAVKRAHPDQTDMQVVSADEIMFDSLVRTMDAAMTAGFPDLSLLDAARAPDRSRGFRFGHQRRGSQTGGVWHILAASLGGPSHAYLPPS